MQTENRVRLVRERGVVSQVLAGIRQDTNSLNQSWKELGAKLPQRGTQPVATAEELENLRKSLAAALTAWEGSNLAGRRSALHGSALALAECLFRAKDDLAWVCQLQASQVDLGANGRSRLAALVRVLIGDASGAEEVLVNMLQLQVLFVAFAGASSQVEQEVELVQISSATPGWLTGQQEHHFGAFYRASWRLNDWMRGRIDGSSQIIQMLLLPDRLRQLGWSADTAYRELQTLAVGPADSPLARDLLAAWNAQEDALRAELSVLNGTEPLPRTFPVVAARIAERLQATMLPKEFQALALAVRSEHDPLPESESWASHSQQVLTQHAVSLGDVRALLAGTECIGRQRIRTEIARTDTFARTASHGFASLGSMLGIDRPRLVGSILSALRGYALLVWVLVNGLTQPSRLGVNLVTLALGVGGALLGVTLIVPGVPAIIPLVGAGLVLGAASATALTNRTQYGRFGWRLLVPVVLVVVALIADVWWTVATTDQEELRSTLLSGVARVLVIVAVVVLGWWFARARPRSTGGGK